MDGWRDAAALAASPFAHGATARARLTIGELEDLWRRRIDERVPLQYLTREAHWGEFVLEVGPGVLIPRPETEELARICVEAAREDDALLAQPWCDVGTGSGALALALCAARRELAQRAPEGADQRVFATDVSADAAAYARRNAAWLGMVGDSDGNDGAPRVEILEGEWLDPLPKGTQLSLLVSNPPYIPLLGDATSLQAEVGRHEPLLALDGGGPDGADALRSLTAQAPAVLVPGGLLALETNAGSQAHELADALSAAGTWADVRLACDLEGQARFVLARRAPRG